MKVKFTLSIFFAFYFSPYAQIGFQEHIITDNLSVPREAYAFDIDGDGDKDVVAVSRLDDKVVWYENIDGLGTYSGEHIITTDTDYPISLSVVDLDGDNDLDVVVAEFFGDKYTWYENTDGLGTFGGQQVISTQINGPFSVQTADLDGDGDFDIVATSQIDENISWYENTDGQGTFGTQQIISINENGQYASTGDMDGDGDIDVVAVSDKVIWFENLDGFGNFSSANLISEELASGTAIYSFDLDGDGDQDLLVSESPLGGGGRVVWYRNLDGLGDFSSELIISNQVDWPWGTFAADIDEDGDLDVFSASYNDDKLAWYENMDGQGTFAEQVIISNTGDGVESVFVSDIDNDGDLDVVSASAVDHKVMWHENIGSAPNSIEGLVSFDILSNSCSSDSLPIAKALVITENNDYIFARFSDEDGSYSMNTPEGVFTTKITSALPTYYASNPVEYISTFIGSGNTTIADFCIEPTLTINDLAVSLYPTSVARPGLNASYKLVFKNAGTTQLDGNIVLTFDDINLSYQFANENPVSQTSNSLVFDYNDLSPFEARDISIYFLVSQSANTGNQTLTASINPISNDYTPDDNVFVLNQMIVNSYDPNDISVLEGESILLEEIDNYLHYIIRFQNTGTAEAIDIIVTNTLDDHLDWQTIQIETSSHDNVVEIENGNELSFIFENILLPDSTSNEPASHGFIAYKIKPKETVGLGDVFSSQADIYFDFNAPVATNTVLTEVVEAIVTNELNTFELSISPIPSKDYISFHTTTRIKKVELYDTYGRLVLSDSKGDYLNISTVPQGVYFCKFWDSGSRSLVLKIVKE